MRLDRVKAHAFGPLRGEELELAPGMTVIGGPNEAGKSTWHAAIRAALTGVRRGRGHPSRAEERFAELHRPWDEPDEWRVEARLVLDGGREIDLVQDLAGKIDSRATDVGLGRDVSSEIIYEGSPDASRWLGLDREAFARTVWVDQGGVLTVSSQETADLLQKYLQQAAASRATDATAGEALERIEEFRRTAVGTDFAPTRPLRSTKDRLEAAKIGLANARIQHAEYMTLMARAEDARASYEEAKTACRAMKATLALEEARQLTVKADRAAFLAGRHPSPPLGVAGRDELGDRVAAALHAWGTRPTPVPLSGPSAAELAAEIAALPAQPDGDLSPHPDVTACSEQLARAQGSLASLGTAPEVGELPITHSGSEVRSLAEELGAELPVVEEVALARLDSERQRVATLQRANRSLLVGLALALFAAAAGLVVGSAPVVAVAAVVVAVLAFVIIRTRDRFGAARRELSVAAAEVERMQRARAIAEARRSDAVGRVRAALLPTDPAALLALAEKVEAHSAAVRDAASWSARRDEAMRSIAIAEEALGRALEARGHPSAEGRAEDRYQAYLAACRERSAQSSAAARGDDLRKALTARREADASHAASAQQVMRAEDLVRSAAAAACGKTLGSPERLVASLEAWQASRAKVAAENDQAIGEWHELQSLLNGGSVSDLAERAAEASRLASELRAGVPPDQLPPIESASQALLADLEADEDKRLRDEAAMEAQRAALARSIPDVAEAEEEVAYQTEELRRIESLATVLDTTIDLLGAAQERVHRDLAPVLAAAVQQHLSPITGGRYTEVAVDPANLGVGVKETWSGQWRQARLLSGGTREQIYLLLRAAMAQHLATTGETVPLFLDEVTAQSDPERASELMRVLHRISQDRQVVVFTHDRTVLDWAEANLTASRDKVVRLDAPVPPSGTEG